MNKTQLDHSETLLNVALPAAYRRFMERLPDYGKGLAWNNPIAIDLTNDPERLAVANLTLRQGPPNFSGKPWPADYLVIGDDGCGNTYCLDLARDDSPLLMFDHDADDFVEIDHVASKVFDRLAKALPKAVEIDLSLNEADRAPVLIVTRAPLLWKSPLAPIGLDEWKACIEADPELEYVGAREMRNPFTGEILRTESPGSARWIESPGRTVPVEYASGRITIRDESPLCLEAMKRIARALNARLFDANDREIAVS